MKVSDEYIEWYKHSSHSLQMDVFNHAIFTINKLKLRDRVWIIFAILFKIDKWYNITGGSE